MGTTDLATAKRSARPFVNFGIYDESGMLVGISQVASGQEGVIFASGVGNYGEKWISISYHFLPSAWGNGIGTEVAKGMIKFAFETLNVTGIHAEALFSNLGSLKVMKNAGMIPLVADDPSYKHCYMNRALYLSGHPEK